MVEMWSNDHAFRYTHSHTTRRSVVVVATASFQLFSKSACDAETPDACI